MIEIYNDKQNLIIKNTLKKEIIFDKQNLKVTLDNFDTTFPWEYEKSQILLEVKEYSWNLFYNFLLEGKHIVIITEDDFEIKEEIVWFFWDIDLLIIKWTKQAAKIFENIEAKIVVPYWEAKDIFLNTLWQNSWEVENYKIKWEILWDSTEFVNLA